jgi:NADPH2:quinone reductase
MEAAGEIVEIGSDVGELTLGERVMLSARIGLFATEAVVPAGSVSRVPATFSMTDAACFFVAAHTARHALVDRAQLRRGETALILGAGGGVGLAAVELAHLLGARVIAAASSADKLAIAGTRGADHLIDYSQGDLVDLVRAVAPDGADVIFDPVGGALFEQALRLPAWNGRLLIVGFASGRIGLASANLPLIKGYSIIGVRAGETVRRDPELAARSARELAAWADQGHLRPHVSATFPLARAGEALRQLESRHAIGRIALIANEDVQ